MNRIRRSFVQVVFRSAAHDEPFQVQAFDQFRMGTLLDLLQKGAVFERHAGNGQNLHTAMSGCGNRLQSAFD